MKTHKFLSPSKQYPLSKLIFDKLTDIVIFSGKDIFNAIIKSNTFLPFDEETHTVFFTKVHLGNLVSTYGIGAVNESLSLMGSGLIRAEKKKGKVA